MSSFHSTFSMISGIVDHTNQTILGESTKGAIYPGSNFSALFSDLLNKPNETNNSTILNSIPILGLQNTELETNVFPHTIGIDKRLNNLKSKDLPENNILLKNNSQQLSSNWKSILLELNEEIKPFLQNIVSHLNDSTEQILNSNQNFLDSDIISKGQWIGLPISQELLNKIVDQIPEIKQQFVSSNKFNVQNSEGSLEETNLEGIVWISAEQANKLIENQESSKKTYNEISDNIVQSTNNNERRETTLVEPISSSIIEVDNKNDNINQTNGIWIQFINKENLTSQSSDNQNIYPLYTNIPILISDDLSVPLKVADIDGHRLSENITKQTKNIKNLKPLKTNEVVLAPNSESLGTETSPNTLAKLSEKSGPNSLLHNEYNLKPAISTQKLSDGIYFVSNVNESLDFETINPILTKTNFVKNAEQVLNDQKIDIQSENSKENKIEGNSAKMQSAVFISEELVNDAKNVQPNKNSNEIDQFNFVQNNKSNVLSNLNQRITEVEELENITSTKINLLGNDPANRILKKLEHMLILVDKPGKTLSATLSEPDFGTVQLFVENTGSKIKTTLNFDDDSIKQSIEKQMPAIQKYLNKKINEGIISSQNIDKNDGNKGKLQNQSQSTQNYQLDKPKITIEVSERTIIENSTIKSENINLKKTNNIIERNQISNTTDSKLNINNSFNSSFEHSFGRGDKENSFANQNYALKNEFFINDNSVPNKINHFSEILKTTPDSEIILKHEQLKEIVDKLVQSTRLQVSPGKSQILVNLKPDYLGMMKIIVENTGKDVNGILLIERQDVRQAIETQLPIIQKSLQDQNVKLDRLEIQEFSSQTNQQNLSHQANQESKDAKLNSNDRWNLSNQKLITEDNESNLIQHNDRNFGYNTLELVA